MTFLKELAARNAVRSAWRTFLQSFAGLFLISAAGWLQDVTAWATDDGLSFPDAKVLVKAAIAAGAAAIIAVIAFIQNGVENSTGKSLPLAPKPEGTVTAQGRTWV